MAGRGDRAGRDVTGKARLKGAGAGGGRQATDQPTNQPSTTNWLRTAQRVSFQQSKSNKRSASSVRQAERLTSARPDGTKPIAKEDSLAQRVERVKPALETLKRTA